MQVRTIRCPQEQTAFTSGQLTSQCGISTTTFAPHASQV